MIHQGKQHAIPKKTLRTLATSYCPKTTWNKLNNLDDISNQKLSQKTETNMKQPETNGTTKTTHKNIQPTAATYSNLQQSRPDQTARN